MQAKKMKLKQGKEVVGDGCWLWCSCESVGGLRRPKFHFGGGPGSVLNCAVSIPLPVGTSTSGFMRALCLCQYPMLCIYTYIHTTRALRIGRPLWGYVCTQGTRS